MKAVEWVRDLPRRERIIALSTVVSVVLAGGLWLASVADVSTGDRYHEIELTLTGVNGDVWHEVRVEAALIGLNGVEDLFVASSTEAADEADAQPRTVTVRFDGMRVSPSQIVQRLARHDYAVTAQSPVTAVSRMGDRAWRATLDSIDYRLNDHGKLVVAGVPTLNESAAEFSASSDAPINLMASSSEPSGHASEFPFTIVEDESTLAMIEVTVTDGDHRHYLRLPVSILSGAGAQ